LLETRLKDDVLRRTHFGGPLFAKLLCATKEVRGNERRVAHVAKMMEQQKKMKKCIGRCHRKMLEQPKGKFGGMTSGGVIAKMFGTTKKIEEWRRAAPSVRCSNNKGKFEEITSGGLSPK